MAAASASSALTDGISLARIQAESITWAPEHVSFDYFASQVQDGLIDLHPPHQRDIVHTDEWQSQIILSALTTGDIPELYFDEVPHEVYGKIKRSLDGKQRGTAIKRFITGEIGFPKRPADIKILQLKCLAGKKINDLTPQNQAVIKNLKLSYRVANRMLTDDEVTDFFTKRQNTKQTKHGEFLNSTLSSLPRQFIVNDMLKRHDVSSVMDAYRTKMKGTLKRCGDIEFIAKALYHYTHRDANPKIDCPISKLREWWANATPITELDKTRFIARFTQTIAFILEHDLKSPGKSVLLPIFAYICKYGNDSYLKSYFSSRTEFDNHVGGDHGASRSRFDSLVKLRV